MCLGCLSFSFLKISFFHASLEKEIWWQTDHYVEWKTQTVTLKPMYWYDKVIYYRLIMPHVIISLPWTQTCDLLMPTSLDPPKNHPLPSLVARGMHSRWAALNRCHCELETDGNEGSPRSGSPAAVLCTRCQGVMTAQQGGTQRHRRQHHLRLTLSLTHPHAHTHKHTWRLCKGAKRRGVSSNSSLQECGSRDLSEETSDRLQTNRHTNTCLKTHTLNISPLPSSK